MVTSLASPTITSFSPSTAYVGSLITIIGTDLSNPTTINVGGTSAIQISNDGSTLVAMVMPGAISGSVSITTPNGTTVATQTLALLSAQTPNTQVGNKIIGTGNIGNSQQGSSVSVSADGRTAIVGGPFDDGNIGAAWVYTFDGATWTQQGSKLVGSGNIGNSYQGASVAISADGNSVVVGGYGDNLTQGAVWIFTRSEGIWSQQGNKLVGNDNVGAAFQGRSVAITADGNTIISGGEGDNNSQGAAWIFTRSGTNWTQQGNKLVGTGNIGAAAQGIAVSISADGTTAIVGGFYDNNWAGAAWIYVRNSGIWTQQGNKLLGIAGVGSSLFGQAVCLNADGNTAAIGGGGDNNGNGAVWTFTRNLNMWMRQGFKLVGTGNIGTARQGSSISLSGDGNIMIVGGNSDNSNQGAAWTFNRSSGSWTQKGKKLVGTGNVGAAFQGNSVSLSSDGSVGLIGGLKDNSDLGAVWAYRFIASNNANLKSINLLYQTLAPIFSVSTTNYTSNVLGATTSIMVAPEKAMNEQAVEVRVNGGTYVTLVGTIVDLSLNQGINTIDIKVTAEDATTTKIYTVTVVRAPAAPVITSFSSSSGVVGSTLVLTGKYFNLTPAENIVFFGATKSTVSAVTPTSITTTVPIGATYAPITVLNSGSGLSGSSSLRFNPIYSPAKTNITLADFNLKQNISTETQPYSITIGDLDGDGKSDLIVANCISNTVSVFRNTSTGGAITSSSFAAKVDFATGSRPYSIAVADLDGDGKQDLVVSNDGSNSISVLRNTSVSGIIDANSFATKVDFNTENYPRVVAAGDLDGDGKPELVVATRGSNSVSVFLNTGISGAISSSSFAPKVDLKTAYGPISVAIGDLDGDGKPDLVATCGSNLVSIFRNKITDGTITEFSFAQKVDVAVGTGPWSVAIGDLDGDGKLDLAVALITNSVSILRNTAVSGAITASSFAPKVEFIAGIKPRFITLGDLDGDGKPELVLANGDPNSTSVSVLRNLSTSGSIVAESFSPKVDFATGTYPNSVAIGDLDGDGRPDLATSNLFDDNISILRNADIVDLNSLTISAGTISPTFAAGTTTYTASVGSSVSSITTTPTNVNTLATIAVNTVAVTSGSASGAITLNLGSNVISILVTSLDGTTKTYTITVNREDPLPVTFISFDAKLNNTGMVDLTWLTASEKDNSHFIILKSTDGVTFAQLAKISVSGNSNQQNRYQTADNNPANGNNYYQLVQYDTDGKATVLATKVINVSLNKTNEITVYPNPAQNVVNISFESDQYNSVKLIDINGKVLIMKSIATKESQVSLEISNLPSATYIIQLNGKAGAVSKTIVKN